MTGQAAFSPLVSDVGFSAKAFHVVHVWGFKMYTASCEGCSTNSSLTQYLCCGVLAESVYRVCVCVV